jgi:membrane-bound serine protease (ClpP class)
MFLLVAFVLLLVLPSPWNLVGGGVAGALFVLEVGFWHRRVRGQRASTGEEALVGARGVVVRRLAPTGQVRVLGELWEARSTTDVPSGASVVVTAVHGLLLEVEAAENGSGPGITPIG